VKPAKIDGAPIADLLELLKVYEDRTRGRAKRELAQRDSDKVMVELGKWIEALDKDDPEFEHQQLEALWIHQMHNRVNEDLLDRVLASKDHRARAAAVRVLSFWLDQMPKPLDRLKKYVGDPHPRVRLESVRALSFLSGDEAIEVALEVLNHEMDYYLEYTLDETMRVLEQ
jgi:HEAT repeat protein